MPLAGQYITRPLKALEQLLFMVQPLQLVHTICCFYYFFECILLGGLQGNLAVYLIVVAVFDMFPADIRTSRHSHVNLLK